MWAHLQTGDAASARALWAKTKDPDITSIHMPAKMVAERSLVSALCPLPFLHRAFFFFFFFPDVTIFISS